MTKWKGTEGPVLTSIRKVSDAREGNQVIYTYQGSQAAIDTLLASPPTGSETIDATFVDGQGVATVRYGHIDSEFGGQPEVPENVWEYGANMIEQDYREHPNYKYLSQAEKNEFEWSLKGGPNGTPQDPGESTLTGDALELYTDVAFHGHDVFMHPEYVLRHTEVVSGNFAIVKSLKDVNRMLTPIYLNTEETIPGDIKFELPDQEIPPGGTSPADNFGWWHKQPPQIAQQGNRKWSIIQEWWWTVSFSDKLYGDSIGTPTTLP